MSFAEEFTTKWFPTNSAFSRVCQFSSKDRTSKLQLNVGSLNFLFLFHIIGIFHFAYSQGLSSPFKHGDGMSHLEARYPAILFKQQLTACVEKIFGLMRDSLKKELSPLLGSCIQVC